MAAVAAAKESELQAAAPALEPAPTPTAAAADARPLATLDPRLLMAARRGDSKALKDLLQLNDDDGNDDQQGQGTRPDDDGSGTPTTAAGASTTTSVAAAPSISPPHVIVEVDPRRPHDDAVAAPLPPPPVPVVLDEDEATTHTEGGSLLVHSETVEQVVEPAPPHDDDAAALPARQPPPPAAAPAGPSAVPVVLDKDGVTIQGDSLLHVVAACGDGEEYLHCAKMIVHEKKSKGGAAAVRLVLKARNRKGDTPLHCAAGAGNADMISCLIDLVANTDEAAAAAAAASVKALARTQNKRGETALHQALRAAKNQVACIDQLMDVDPELACIPCDDEDGASPLYLAISLGEVDIARHLYSKSKGRLSYSGPDGRNVLHAAVYRGQALPMILGWLAEDMNNPKEEDGPPAKQKQCPDNVNVQGEQHMISGKSSRVSPLVSRLTSQRDRKQKGSTPLHLAASLDWWPGAGLLSTMFPQVWPAAKAMGTLLLDANEPLAYQADDEGSYPIHVAAWSNSIVVKVLLERCPDCATLRDGKGRTFLHVAAEMKNHSPAVVQYVCGEMPQQLSSMILNAQDSNGDTALHNAVRAENLAVFNCLLRNPRVRLDVANKDGMTPLDLSWTKLPRGFNYLLNPGGIVRTSLLHVGAPYGGGRPELFAKKRIPKRDPDKESKKHTEATQVMSIVTALIATVTFASAFTLPGGYRSDGEPVLAGSYAFDAFILADTLAFICSISATYFLVYVGVPAIDVSIRFRYFNISSVLMQSAARSLVAAFGLGLYLVVHHTASAIAACAIVFASSIYGNIEVWRVIRMATTVFARIGIRRDGVVGYARRIYFTVLIHFWSYVIIFGLPAIRKRVH